MNSFVRYDEEIDRDNFISGEFKVKGLLLDANHTATVSEAIAYFSDGTYSKLTFSSPYDIGYNLNTLFMEFNLPEANVKVVDSIVGKLNYFTPTEKNKSIYKFDFIDFQKK